MSDWVIPAPLTRPVPRKVAMSEQALILTAVIVGVFGLLFIALIGISISGEFELRGLEKRGVEVSGTVVGLAPAVTGQGRNDHGPLLDYTYEPPEYALKPDRVIHAEKQVSQALFQTLTAGARIPLVYDPLHPEHSQMESFIAAHRLGQTPPTLSPSLLLITLIPIGLLFTALQGHFREKRLLRWGKAAKATIIGEFEYTVKRRPMAKVIYSFEDERGVVRQGEMGGLPARDDPSEPFFHERQRFLANPIVVYDPRDSRRHMLYPGAGAKLA